MELTLFGAAHSIPECLITSNMYQSRLKLLGRSPSSSTKLSQIGHSIKDRFLNAPKWRCFSLETVCMRNHITVWSDCILNWWRQGPQSPVTLRKLRLRRPPAGGDSQACLKGEWKGTHRGYSRALQILPERGGTESAVDVRDRKDCVWTQRIQGEITLTLLTFTAPTSVSA